MDISIIDASKVTTTNGIKIGEDTAPKKIVEFMNLRCPFCKQWFEESYDLLEKAVVEGKVQRIIKLFDKEKESLQRGNIMQHHITWNDGTQALADIKKAYAAQDEWGELSLTDVALYAEQQLGLTEQTNQEMVDHIITEAEAANIKFVPTCVVEDEIFDENISLDKLAEILAL